MGLLELVEANWWWAGGVGRVGGGQQAGPSSSTAHGGTTASGTTTFPEPIFGIFDIFDIFGTLLPSFWRHPYYEQDNFVDRSSVVGHHGQSTKLMKPEVIKGIKGNIVYYYIQISTIPSPRKKILSEVFLAPIRG